MKAIKTPPLMPVAEGLAALRTAGAAQWAYRPPTDQEDPDEVVPGTWASEGGPP